MLTAALMQRNMPWRASERGEPVRAGARCSAAGGRLGCV